MASITLFEFGLINKQTGNDCIYWVNLNDSQGSGANTSLFCSRSTSYFWLCHGFGFVLFTLLFSHFYCFSLQAAVDPVFFQGFQDGGKVDIAADGAAEFPVGDEAFEPNVYVIPPGHLAHKGGHVGAFEWKLPVLPGDGGGCISGPDIYTSASRIEDGLLAREQKGPVTIIIIIAAELHGSP